MVIEDIPPELIGSGLGSLFEVTQPFFKQLSFLVGGIFGLYVLLILIRIYFERKKVNILKDIRYDLDKLNIHYGLSYSKDKKSFFGKISAAFKEKKEERSMRKGFEKLGKDTK